MEHEVHMLIDDIILDENPTDADEKLLDYFTSELNSYSAQNCRLHLKKKKNNI